MSGLKIAALYGLAPHQLGLCGPKEALAQGVLKKFLRGKESKTKTKQALKKFKGAYPYYRLIARSNNIKDSFHKKVVSAYWIGNDLLDRVKLVDLQKMVAQDFSGPGLLSKKLVSKKLKEIPQNSKPHHSFHVLVIGSVTGVVDFTKTKLKDICRISWGRVTKISAKGGSAAGGKSQKFKVLLEYQPLIGEKIIKLGKPVKKEIIWDKEIVPEVKIGDWVSFHWGRLVQVLTKKDIANLKKYTLNTLNSLP